VTYPLEEGDQSGQLGPDQAATLDRDGQRSLVELLATRTPPGVTTMLLNRQRRLLDVDLLDHTGLAQERRLQLMATTGTEVDAMIEEPGVYGFGREWIPLVFWVPGLATDRTPFLALRERRLGRFDDIGRRRLGRSRGILLRRGELLLKSSDKGLERFKPRLQAPTIRARLPCLGFHGTLSYRISRKHSTTTPVNGYAHILELISATRELSAVGTPRRTDRLTITHNQV